MTVNPAQNNASHNDWLSWFESRPSATAIAKEHQKKLLATFDASISKEQCIEALLQHEETVYLQKTCFNDARVTTFHHVVVVGGTLYETSTKEYGCLQGLGDLTTTAVMPDMENLCKVESETNVAVPTATNMMRVTTEAQVSSLAAGARSVLKPRNFVPVPPFLLEAVFLGIDKDNGSAMKTLLRCIAAVKKFDEDHENDGAYKDKAAVQSLDFVYWLYLVSQNHDSIAAVPAMGCSNSKIAKKLDGIKRSALETDQMQTQDTSIAQQVEMSLKRPFEVLAATSSSTSEFMERLTKLQSSQNEKSSKSFNKLPHKYQQLMLVASSKSEITEVKYSADASEFFKCTNTLNAQVMLNSLFETEGIDCAVSTAVATTLLYGSLLWKDALSPSGFASSVLSSTGVMRPDSLHEGMVLDYSTKFDISAANLQKLTKTQVLFPKDIEELIHRIKGFQVLAEFFFKKNGYLSQGLKKVANFCSDNRMVLKTRLYLDNSFIAQFLCAIDDRVHQWLRQCSSRQSIIETDLALVNFTPLLSDVQLNRFTYLLPPSIARIVQRREEDKGSNNEVGSNNKKKVNSVMVRNQNPESDWKLRAGENWGTVFRHKSVEGPILSLQCKPCLKFHVKGVCYDDCRQKSSHKILCGEDRKLMDRFVKSLRGE